MTERPLISVKPETPDDREIYIAGEVHHSHIDVEGWLTSWNEDPKTGKKSNYQRRYVGSIWDV